MDFKILLTSQPGYVKLERAVGKNEKLEAFRLESPTWNCKEWNWKVRAASGNFGLKLESFNWTRKESMKLESYYWRNFSTSLSSFQIRSVLSNFARLFPTQTETFQLRQKLSNVRLSNCSFFPTALSNYTYPWVNRLELKSNTWPPPLYPV